MLFFWTFYSSKNSENVTVHSAHKNINHHNTDVFNIDRNSVSWASHIKIYIL